eukprot:7089891-Ditylum_brightwellii.AAC.1
MLYEKKQLEPEISSNIDRIDSEVRESGHVVTFADDPAEVNKEVAAEPAEETEFAAEEAEETTEDAAEESKDDEVAPVNEEPQDEGEWQKFTQTRS